MLLDCWVACRPGAGQQRPPSYRRPARLGAERSGAERGRPLGTTKEVLGSTRIIVLGFVFVHTMVNFLVSYKPS